MQPSDEEVDSLSKVLWEDGWPEDQEDRPRWDKLWASEKKEFSSMARAAFAYIAEHYRLERKEA